MLRKEFSVDTAVGGDAALVQCAKRQPYSVIVADMQMPGMNGVEFLTQVEQRYPDTVRIMLTGNADQKTARDAVNKGHIFRFLTKPCPSEELIPALKAGIRQHALITAERQLLEQTLNGCARALIEILSIHDAQSFGQGSRLRDAMKTFAESLKLGQTWDLELAALLSQIGFVSIPQAVLQKYHNGETLSGPELDVMARAPKIGSDLLSNIPRLESVARIILYQNKHLRWVGLSARWRRRRGHSSRRPHSACAARPLHLRGGEQDEGEGPRIDERAVSVITIPKVLEAVAASFVFCLTPPENGPRPLPVSLKELSVWHILKSHVPYRDGLHIAPRDSRCVTLILLEKLRNFARLNALAEPILIVDSTRLARSFTLRFPMRFKRSAGSLSFRDSSKSTTNSATQSLSSCGSTSICCTRQLFLSSDGTT